MCVLKLISCWIFCHQTLLSAMHLKLINMSLLYYWSDVNLPFFIAASFLKYFPEKTLKKIWESLHSLSYTPSNGIAGQFISYSYGWINVNFGQFFFSCYLLFLQTHPVCFSFVILVISLYYYIYCYVWFTLSSESTDIPTVYSADTAVTLSMILNQVICQQTYNDNFT